MKRVLLCALSVFLVAATLGLTGCEGGGIEPGAPTDSAPVPGATDKMKEMADMTKGPKMPTGKDAPKPAAATGTPAEAPKN